MASPDASSTHFVDTLTSRDAAPSWLPLSCAPAPPATASPGGVGVGPRGVEARGAARGRERGGVPRLDNVALGAKVVLAVSEGTIEIVLAVLAPPFLMVDAELRLPVLQLRGAASSFE